MRAQLPHHRFTKALIIGIVAGLFCAFQSVVITLVNSSTYQTYVTSGTQQNVQYAIALDRKSTRLNSSHRSLSRMPSSA